MWICIYSYLKGFAPCRRPPPRDPCYLGSPVDPIGGHLGDFGHNLDTLEHHFSDPRVPKNTQGDTRGSKHGF